MANHNIPSTDWSQMTFEQMWNALKFSGDDEVISEQARAWGRLSELLRNTHTNLFCLHNNLMVNWRSRPTPDSAVQLFNDRTEELLDSLDRASTWASNYSAALWGFSSAIANAQERMKPLVERYQQESESGDTDDWEDLQEELAEQARPIMQDLATRIRQSVQDNLREAPEYRGPTLNPNILPNLGDNGGGPTGVGPTGNRRMPQIQQLQDLNNLLTQIQVRVDQHPQIDQQIGQIPQQQQQQPQIINPTLPVDIQQPNLDTGPILSGVGTLPPPTTTAPAPPAPPQLPTPSTPPLHSGTGAVPAPMLPPGIRPSPLTPPRPPALTPPGAPPRGNLRMPGQPNLGTPRTPGGMRQPTIPPGMTPPSRSNAQRGVLGSQRGVGSQLPGARQPMLPPGAGAPPRNGAQNLQNLANRRTANARGLSEPGVPGSRTPGLSSPRSTPTTPPGVPPALNRKPVQSQNTRTPSPTLGSTSTRLSNTSPTSSGSMVPPNTLGRGRNKPVDTDAPTPRLAGARDQRRPVHHPDIAPSSTQRRRQTQLSDEERLWTVESPGDGVLRTPESEPNVATPGPALGR